MILTEFLRNEQPGPLTLNIRGRLVAMDRPFVMGILNLTPDSFYAPSRTLDPADAVRRVGRMLEEEADFIDIGACSTRPGSQAVGAEEELKRLEAPLEAIRKAFPDAVISLDTFRASVADEAIRRWDVDIINDITGGADPAMYDTIARHNSVYILMHNRGTCATVEGDEDYGRDIGAKVIEELAFKVNEARKAGVCNLIVDPGFGFSKSAFQDLSLLSHLHRFSVLGCPVLVGLSRKRMTRQGADADEDTARKNTNGLNSTAIMAGANIIRVHDVAEGVKTARITMAIRKMS